MKFNILLSFTKAKKIKENNHDKLLREQHTCTLDVLWIMQILPFQPKVVISLKIKG